MVQWPGWLMAVVLPVAQYSCSLNVFPFLKCCVLNACTPNFCLHNMVGVLRRAPPKWSGGYLRKLLNDRLNEI